MTVFKNLNIFLIISFALTSCDNGQDTAPIDNLVEVGVLGEWQFEMRSVDGISSLAAECCNFLTFTTDEIPTDFKGNFTNTTEGGETQGVFSIDVSNNTIRFDLSDSQLEYNLEIENDLMTFTYTLNNQTIVEDWRKQE